MNKPWEQQLAKQAELTAIYTALIDLQLYASHVIEVDSPSSQAKDLRLLQLRHDMYCPECKKSSTFSSSPLPDDLAHADAESESPKSVFKSYEAKLTPFNWSSRFTLRMVCARANHSVDMYFASGMRPLTVHLDRPGELKFRWTITKVGQTPSLRDFQLGELKEIEDAMTMSQRREFVQAISTGAHGFSVAACVYYRRVFEQLLNEARDEYGLANNITDLNEFDNRYTDEKIRILADHLPPFLVEHPQLYGILSKGVHQLTEEECASELPTLRLAIEVILKEKAAATKAKKLRAEASKLLAQVGDRLK